MTEAVLQLSGSIPAALAARTDAPPAEVHRLQVGLARLVLAHAPLAAAAQLELAVAFIEGRAVAAELHEAKQECWAYVGSLACGCSVADSASAHAVLSCLEAAPGAHSAAALAEQVSKVLRCGASETSILRVLAA